MIDTNIPKIPQSKNKYFKFFVSEKFCSIDIQIEDDFFFFDFKNLFLIIKTYVSHDELLIRHILINSYIDENNFKNNIYHSVKIEKLKKIKYIDFIDWFKEIRNEDYEYIKNLKLYGFRIIFDKSSIIWKNNNFYPKYPWNVNFKKIYFKNELNFKKWIYLKNKGLYMQWVKINKKYKNKLPITEI